jgi:hypothetical protein
MSCNQPHIALSDGILNPVDRFTNADRNGAGASQGLGFSCYSFSMLGSVTGPRFASKAVMRIRWHAVVQAGSRLEAHAHGPQRRCQPGAEPRPSPVRRAAQIAGLSRHRRHDEWTVSRSLEHDYAQPTPHLGSRAHTIDLCTDRRALSRKRLALFGLKLVSRRSHVSVGAVRA